MAQFTYGSAEPEKVTVVGHGGREIQVEKPIAEAMGYELVKPKRTTDAAKTVEKKEA